MSSWGRPVESLSTSLSSLSWSDVCLDIRAVGLCRWALGVATLVEVMELIRFHGAFLDETLCPPKTNTKDMFDIFLAAKCPLSVLLLLLINLFAALCLMFGFWSRLSCFTCWIFALSQHHRLSPCARYDGDELRCHLLFWAILAPLGQAWSVDAYLQCQREKQMEGPGQQPRLPCDLCLPPLCPTKEVSSDHEKDKRLRSTAAPLSAFLVLLQLASMYEYTGSTKVGDTWTNGEAVHRTLGITQFAREPLASIILSFPWLCRLLTHATLYVEKYGWLLAFVPSQLCRAMAFGMFFTLHFGFDLCLRVGSFQWFAMSGWFVALPRCFIDSLEAWFHHRWPRSAQLLVINWDPEAAKPSCGLASMIIFNVVGFSLMYMALAEGCAHRVHGGLGCMVPLPGDFSGNGALASLALKQRYEMFSPNPPTTTFRVQLYGILDSPKCDMNVENYAAHCQVAELWTDKGYPSPEATFPLPTWSNLSAPVLRGVDFATNRWRKLVEKGYRSKGLAPWMCERWKTTHGQPELLGMWLVAVSSVPPDPKETFDVTFRTGCTSDSQKLIEGLPDPAWLGENQPSLLERKKRRSRKKGLPLRRET